MEDFRLHPERRVFHLDTECYVVYVGNDQDDYKPFLRIGNTGHLDKDLRQLVHPIVVTDTYTGSPLLESRNLSDILGDDFRYIGDPETVDRFKRFLKHLEFPSESYESNGGEDIEDRGCFVYFYDDGNIRIKYNQNEIFDLKRREERDLHYTERAKRIKNMLSRSELRIPQKEFQPPGFFVRGGAGYLFAHRAIGALGVRDEYFAELAQAGIDPDRVTAVAADEVTEGLLRLFKRTRGKKEILRIITANPSNVDPAVDLFRGKERLGLRAEAVRLHADRFTSFIEFRVQKRGGGYLVEHGEWSLRLDVPKSDRPKDVGMATLDPSTNTVRYRASNGLHEVSLLDGVPYRVSSMPEPREAVQRYFPQKLNLVSDLVGEGEGAVLQQLMSFFQELDQGADPSSTVRGLRGGVRDLAGEVSGVFWVYAANAITLARLYAREPQDDRRRQKSLEAVGEILEQELTIKPPLSAYPSAVCDMALAEDGVFPLYRFTASLTPDKLAFSSEMAREIASTVTERDHEHFSAEVGRLKELLGELDTSMARVPRAKRGRRAAEEQQSEQGEEAGEDTEKEQKEKAGKQRRSSSSESSRREETPEQRRVAESAVSPDTSALGAAAPQENRAGTRKKRRGGAGRVALVGAVVLLLLLGGAAVLYMMTDVPQRMGLPPIAGLQQNSAAAASTGDASEGSGTDGSSEAAEGDAAPGGGEQDGSDAGPGAGGEASGSGEEAAGSGDDRDSENRPGTPTEQALAEAYADGNGPAGLEERDSVGGLTITILDIIRLANRIAVANGYRPLGGEPEQGPDPDWIFPGNEFEMPDGSTETVVSGDTLWFITAEFIDRRLRERYQQYEQLLSEYNPDTATEAEREELISELQSLREETFSEQFAALLQDQIRAVRGGGSLEQERSE